MLSYQQFISRHPVKYKGLTAQQKRQRYQDYLRSNAVNNNSPTAGVAGRRRRRATRGRARRGSANPPAFVGSNSGEGKFLALYARPFDVDTVGLPVFPSPASAKQTAWLRGTATVGTTGVGFVAGGPATVSDNLSIYYTGAAYAGTTITTGTGITSAGFTNLPISSAGLTDTSGIRARIVLCALRVRYVGTQNNLGGIVYPYVHPLHGQMGGMDINYISGQEDFVSYPVSREWTTIVWVPVHRTECEYYHTINPPVHYSSETSNNVTPMCIMFTGQPGNQFEFQWVLHVEYTGPSSMWLSKTDNQVSQSLTDSIDKLQQPKLALRGSAMPRDLRPVIRQGVVDAARAAGTMGLDYVVSRIRDELRL